MQITVQDVAVAAIHVPNWETPQAPSPTNLAESGKRASGGIEGIAQGDRNVQRETNRPFV